MIFNFSSFTSVLKEKSVSGHNSIVGIDIGSSAVKIVQIKDVKGIPTLETYGELQLGPYEGIEIGRCTHLPTHKLIEAIIDIFRESSVTEKRVSYALSYNASFVTNITVPTLDQDKIGAMIPIEARKYVPLSLNKVTLEWFPLSVHADKVETNVLVTAVNNEVASRYDMIMKGCELYSEGGEVEIFSSVRAAVSSKDATVALIDFGASATRLYVVHNGTLIKTHSVPLSGTGLTELFVKEAGLSFTDAEKTKRSIHISEIKEPKVEKAVVDYLNRGLRELHTFCVRGEEEEKIEIAKVILCGDGALLLGIESLVHEMFLKPVEFAKPFAKISYPAFLEDTVTLIGPSFVVAIGAALRVFRSEQKKK